MFNKKLIATGIALGLGMIGSAQASLFTFDPDGAGAGAAVNNAALIDESPGNSLALGVGGGFAAVSGTQFTLLYQANLNSIQDVNNNNLFSQGTGGNFFTIAGAFPEVVVSGTATGATFGLGTGTTNAFNIYYNTTGNGNNLTGLGFVSPTNVLSAHVVQSTGAFNFATTSSSGCHNVGGVQVGNLDQSPNGNQWGAQQTACGNGSASLTLVVDSADANFFPDLLSGTQFVLHLANASLVDPFASVDPSRRFSSNGVANGDRATNLGTGGVNGLSCGTSAPPCDFIFQSDANGTFVKAPEPATPALFGLGLAAIGWLSRKRKGSR